jgi:hypothetical protein
MSNHYSADADGAFHGFKWTGQDAFSNRNILGIALAVPSDMLSMGPVIGVWPTVSVRRGPDGLKPHDDLVSEFPFLGVPNRYPV